MKKSQATITLRSGETQATAFQGRQGAESSQIPSHAPFRDDEAELQKLAMDLWGPHDPGLPESRNTLPTSPMAFIDLGHVTALDE